MKRFLMSRFTETGRMLRALENGKFSRVLGKDGATEWIKYVDRQTAIPHTKKVVMRLTMESDSNPWYLWSVYHVISTNPIFVKLHVIILPSEDDGNLLVPDDIAGLDYFEA